VHDDLPPTTTFGNQPRTPSEADVEAALTPAGRIRLGAALAATHRRMSRDAAIAFASGRWNPGRPDPDRYRPGDVVALRAFSVSADLHRLFGFHDVAANPDAQSEQQHAAVARILTLHPDIAALYDAIPHFLDGPTAHGILSSRAPEPDVIDAIRLPYPRVAVFFGRTFAIPETLQDWPTDWDHLVDLNGDPTRSPSSLGDLRRLGGGIEGVVVTEAPGGGLADEALWIVSVNPDRGRGELFAHDRYRALEWGRLSSSRLAHVATNAAAAVSWGEWRQPDRSLDLPDDLSGRQRRRAVRRGEFRRHEPQGAAAGVRVLDLCRSPVATRDHPGGLDNLRRRSPTTHIRRAHWRLQPHGPGGSSRKLIRVGAVVVNPGAGDMAQVVYQVPVPDPGDPTFSARPTPTSPSGPATTSPGIGRTPPSHQPRRGAGVGR
jgi:hypothetical protein